MPIETIRKFLKLQSASGILIIVFAVLSLACANLPHVADVYQAFLEIPIEVKLGGLELEKNVLLVINDFLMAIFFLLMGLEIKREFMEGELKGKLALTITPALFGVLVPSAIYAALNWNDSVAINGWAIPAATDIAFALGILSLLGSRVPTALKAFLMAVAVVDDLAAIVIIAIFYTSQLSFTALLIGLGGLAALLVLNRLGCRNLAVYFWIGLIVWVCVLKSGVHATLAGVAVGLAIPLNVKSKDGQPEPFASHVEHMLHPWVAFVIMPLFAFANAGVSFAGVSPENMVASSRLGIMLGLIVGKPVGILVGAFLIVKTGLARLPLGITWSRLFGVGLLAGIGFTMSLFIGTLAFEGAGPGYAVSVRLGVLGGSLIAAVLGYLWLRFTLRSEAGEDVPPPEP
jgi:NhaA family Na+:H+ antiporter